MKRPVQNARGAILIMAAIIMVVLIGVAALALDLGRLFVLHTEMQNAVDAAAISAAAELDGEDNAQERAMAAANQEMLNHLSHFGNKAELLENLQNKEGLFTFYSWIGSNVDSLVPPCTPEYGKCEIDDPSDNSVSYVKITLDPDPALFGTDDYRYEIDLYFLPVLSLFGIETATTASTKVEALAGSHYEVCNYPPMFICDPNVGGDPLETGEMVKLKEHGPGDQWAVGSFGWLIPTDEDEHPNDDPGDDGLSGNKLLGYRLGSIYGQGCTPAIIDTGHGDKGQFPRWGLNTRFGIYGTKAFNNGDVFPSAPNVIDYPRDYDLTEKVTDKKGVSECSGIADARFGDGAWGRTDKECNPNEPTQLQQPSTYTNNHYDEYFHVNDGFIPPDEATRNNYYQAEFDQDLLAASNINIAFLHPDETQCDDKKNSCRMLNGLPFTANVDDDDSDKRRELFVAAVDCTDPDFSTNQPMSMEDVGGKWMRFFMTEHVDHPGGGGLNVYAEFIEEVTEREDEHFKTVIQLYE